MFTFGISQLNYGFKLWSYYQVKNEIENCKLLCKLNKNYFNTQIEIFNVEKEHELVQ